MENISILQIITYLSYAFIIGIYAWRTYKYARMPVHLRWELYPIPSERGHKYGGSYYEQSEWWTKPQPKKTLRNIAFMVKDYLYFMQYYQQNRGYWFALYPLHLGFYLIFISHVLFFLGGLALLLGLPISSSSSNLIALLLYYLTLITSVGGCALGSLGCIALFIKRAIDKDLRSYSAPVSYFNYLFFLLVFLSGLYSWYFFAPTLSAFREFWKALISISPSNVDTATALHIILFSLFLIYMPFTRAMHYIAKYFTFFSVRWDDKAILAGSTIEKKLQKAFSQPVSWSAPHIQRGRKWSEIVSEAQHPNQKA